MYEWIPKKTNNKARNIIILFFFGAAALLAVTSALGDVPFLWVFQLAAVALLTAAVFLTTRFLTKMYIYRIDVGERGADLVVLEAASNGKRQTAVCRVALANVKERTLLDASDGASDCLKAAKQGGRGIYDYRPDLKPEKSILIVAEEGGEDIPICLAFDERLYELLAPQSPSDGEVTDDQED